MSSSIVTALISGLCVAIPSIITVIATANTRDAVNEERIKYLSEKIDALSAKVQLHNNFETRIVAIEKDLKTALSRIEEIRRK